MELENSSFLLTRKLQNICQDTLVLHWKELFWKLYFVTAKKGCWGGVDVTAIHTGLEDPAVESQWGARFSETSRMVLGNPHP
jgi:hypothetical protein